MNIHKPWLPRDCKIVWMYGSGPCISFWSEGEQTEKISLIIGGYKRLHRLFNYMDP